MGTTAKPGSPGQGTVSDNHAEGAEGADDGAAVVPLLASPLPCSIRPLRLAWTGPPLPNDQRTAFWERQAWGRERGVGTVAASAT